MPIAVKFNNGLTICVLKSKSNLKVTTHFAKKADEVTSLGERIKDYLSAETWDK